MRRADREAFTAFVVARQPALLRSATLLTGDAHLAQDLLQEALVKLALRWDRVGHQYPEAFVRKVLYRDAISWSRRHRRERVGGDEWDGALAADAVGAVDDRITLWSALDRLTVKQRAVLVLRFYEDLSEHQAAEVLGVSVGTVKSQTHAALARMRALSPHLISASTAEGDS